MLLIWFIRSTLLGTTYYVSPSGTTTNSGLSISSPITFQKAADIVMPGDIVYVRGGDYYPPSLNTYTPIMRFTRLGGSATGGYVRFVKYPNDAAKAVLHPYTGDGSSTGSGSWSLVKVHTDGNTPTVVPQYIHFEGLDFVGNADDIDPATEPIESQPGAYCYDANNDGLVNDGCDWSCADTDNDHVPDGCEWVRYNGQGLLVTGPFAWDPDIKPLVNRQKFDNDGNIENEIAGLNNYAIPHHITVKDCKFTDFPGAGMSFQRADYITVEGCTVANNCWYTVFGSSGINFYQFVPSNFQNPQYNDNEYRNMIVNNIVYGNTLKVKNQNLVVRYDGNGVIVDDFYHAQDYDPNNTTTFPNRGNIKYGIYKGRTLVSNNVLFGNGGSGLKVYSTQYVDVFNNTLFNNGIGNYRYFRTVSPKESDRAGDLSRQASLFVQSIVDEQLDSRPTIAKGYNRIYNNVTYNTIGYGDDEPSKPWRIDYDVALGPNDGNLASNNIHGVDPQYEDITGTHIALEVPYKVHEPTGLFALQNTSPAINAGLKVWDGAVATQAAIAFDILRFTRDALPDAGAHELTKPCIEYIKVGSNHTVEPAGIKTILLPSDRTVYQCLKSMDIKDVMDIKPGATGVFIAEVINTCNDVPNPAHAARMSNDRVFDFEDTENTKEAVFVYPNPVTDGTLNFSKVAQDFKIFNSSGSLMLQGTATDSVSVTRLHEGLYIIQIDGVGHVFVVE